MTNKISFIISVHFSILYSLSSNYTVHKIIVSSVEHQLLAIKGMKKIFTNYDLACCMPAEKTGHKVWGGEFAPLKYQCNLN